jgi:hypothetical protein
MTTLEELKERADRPETKYRHLRTEEEGAERQVVIINQQVERTSKRTHNYAPLNNDQEQANLNLLASEKRPKKR